MPALFFFHFKRRNFFSSFYLPTAYDKTKSHLTKKRYLCSLKIVMSIIAQKIRL